LGAHLLHCRSHVNKKHQYIKTDTFQLGGATCLWAFVIWFLLPDSPSNARFLNHRERLIAVKRVAANETGIKNKAFDNSQVVLGFTDPKTLLIFVSVFAA
jgi:hypothetical protein